MCDLAKKRLPYAMTSLTVFIFTMGVTASAQWVNFRLAGIPRTADGKPNLTAPVPRAADGKPDLSGLWRNMDVRYLNDLSADGLQVPFTPQAAALYKERQEKNAKGRPSESCLPHGIPDSMIVPAAPFKIVQHPGVVLILYEFQKSLSPGVYGRPRFSRRDDARLAGIFHRKMGRRHIRCRDPRIQ